MAILRLMHPKLGLCAQQNTTQAYSSDFIQKQWKARYGKAYDLCSVIIEKQPNDDRKGGRPMKKVENVRTGEIYDSISHAATSLSLNELTIRRQCNRDSQSKYNTPRVKECVVKWA